MSTSASTADLAPAWKQEVNKRLAAHMSRKSPSMIEQDAPGVVKQGSRSLAAEAAARVAARYAKAPSYSEMLAGEARAAVRAAEAASRAALEAQAAAEFVLAGLEQAPAMEEPWEPMAFHGGGSERALELAWEATVEPAQVADTGYEREPKSNDSGSQGNESDQVVEQPSYGVRWETDLPVRDSAPEGVSANHEAQTIPGVQRSGMLGALSAAWWGSPSMKREGYPSEEEDGNIEVVEPAEPMHANLIEFPRELVATRKMRPRLADGPFAAAGDATGQLSIFEVDPGSISIEPPAPEIVTVPAADWPSVAPVAGSDWTGSNWSGIKLDEPLPAAMEVEEAPAKRNVALQPASIGLRLMATVVDCALMTFAFFVAALVVMEKAKDLPTLREVEMSAVVALLAIGALYQVFFFTLGAATPGMKWARLSLCTLTDARPTRAQRCGRLIAMALSLLPVGLGVAWAIFDEEHLSWHDRLSGTYLRRV